ncbi:hypothetical protein LN461_07405 [Xanthomonas arboricola]|uniref:hypothetical protein n=1 Tax=Xanthomonas arboricola TaxID=56448 RepID=UPI001E50CCF6|nr:hypothetical protein [Xanthomonas arboricola]MCC8669177.1 hypothetical protein [Xanthomonas arboricola]
MWKTESYGDAVIVKSDGQAWILLEKLLAGEQPGDTNFKGWPVLDIKLSGDDYESSLNSGQMAALVDLKDVFGRAYSVVAHGAYDMRRLKADEDEQLQFRTKVKKGSSILETDFTPLVKAFSNAVAANPQLALISALVLGLVLVSKPVILKHYENKAKQLELEDKKLLLASIKPEQGDKAKLALLDKAIAKVTEVYPQFAQVIPDARGAFWRFAASSVDADSMTIDGLVLSQDDLELLANRRSRRLGDKQLIKEICSIKSVRKSGSHYIVGLQGKNVSLGAKFMKPQLSEARIKKLFGHMASEQKIEVKLEVRVVDKANLSGRLIAFKPKAE